MQRMKLNVLNFLNALNIELNIEVYYLFEHLFTAASRA